MGNTKTNKANNKTNKTTNNQVQSTVPTGVNTFITPQRVVNWLKQTGALKGTTLTNVLGAYSIPNANSTNNKNKQGTPITPAMLTKHAKNILWFNTATNAALSARATKPQGFNCQGSNFAGYANKQNKPLVMWQITPNKGAQPVRAWVVGEYPLGQRPNCYFIFNSCVNYKKATTPPHASGPNNTHVFASNATAHALAVALAPLIASMPNAQTLPPCNTWG